MSYDSGYRDDPAPSQRSGRPHPAERIGWIAAGRLAAGISAGRGSRHLNALLTAAAQLPAPDRFDPAESEELTALLAAYRDAAYRNAAESAPRTSRARTSRRVGGTRLLLVKCAAALFVVAGTGLATATAGMLPDPVQRLAHDYFGSVGVPAPSASGGAGSPTTPASGSPAVSQSPSAVAGSADAATTALCRTVADDPQKWHAELDATDQALLDAAAGGNEKVVAYCTRIIASDGSAEGNGASASAGATGTSSPTASGAQPTATHGAPHPSHSPSPGPQTSHPSPSPNPHGTAH